MLVMDYKKDNLRNYLDKNFKECKWKHLIEILFGALIGLKRIHNLGFIHCSLHSGNILVNGVNSGGKRKIDVFITGFGHSSDVIKTNPGSDRETLIGILPYIAPEVLCGKPRSKESDVYSFGVIMTEIATGKPPFYDRPHDENLARQICEQGLRPEINTKVAPGIYIGMARQCLDANPAERPTFEKLEGTLQLWYDALNQLGGFPHRAGDIATIRGVFSHCDTSRELKYERHREASYIRRKLEFGKFKCPEQKS